MRSSARPTREAPVLHAVRHALASSGRVLLWRSNTGVDLTRGVTYGLGVGSADLVGLLRPSGRFAAWEVKSQTGRASPAQLLWADAVRAAGGFVTTVRSADEALASLERALAGADR